MADTKTLIRNILDQNLIGAKDEAYELLYQEAEKQLGQKRSDLAQSLFATEGKKAPVTDKDNDSDDDSGETLDPVGKGDADIDNDGDSDEEDAYLKNRRKAVTKSVKNESTKVKEQDDEEDEEEDDEEVDEGKLPPWLKKNQGKKNGKNGDDEDDKEEDDDE